MKKFSILFFAAVVLLCLPALGYSQCGPGGCGGGFGFAPSFVSSYSFAPPIQWEPPYTGPDGRIYEKYTDGTWRARMTTATAIAARCQGQFCQGANNCDASGRCSPCGNCGSKGSVASNCPECAALIDTKKLTEVKPDAKMGLFQDDAGNLYYLPRDAVASSTSVLPAGKWVWTTAAAK